MKKLSILFIIILTWISCSPKKSAVLTKRVPIFSMSKNILIDKSDPGIRLGPCEPSICIDQSNPDHIVAGSILDRIHLSKDGGKTWENSKLTSSVGVYGDPVLRVGNDGTYYYSHLTNPSGGGFAASEDFLDRIQVQASTDGGKTWNDGTAPGSDRTKDQDKQWLFVDPLTDEVLMSWTEFDKYGDKEMEDCSRILFSKSSDKGMSWTHPVMISDVQGNCEDDDLTTEGAVPAMDKDGNIYVTWAHGETIYMDKSTDGGKTWLKKDKRVTEISGGWTYDIPGISRCNGMPILGIDRSNGPHSGTLYVNWSDQLNGTNDTDIWLVKSTDGGKTWTKRKRVNDDAPGKHQFFTWMDIDPMTGYIYMVFYDRRHHENNDTDVYLAYSTDGGESFKNVKISDTPFNPNPFIFFGDYNDISAYNGEIRPIWTRSEGKNLSVWTSLISLK